VTTTATAVVDKILANGVRVVCEQLPSRRGVTLELLVRFGAVDDPSDLPGAATLAWGWQERGAQGLSARERRDALAELGVRTGGTAGRERSLLSARMTMEAFPEALPLWAAELLTPDLDDVTFETARLHALDVLDALEDRPDEQLEEALHAVTFQTPYGRSPHGRVEGVDNADPQRVRNFRTARLGPAGALLVVTGGLDPARALELVASAFGGWSGAAPAEPGPRRFAPPTRHHETAPGEQTQLGWSFPVLPPGDPQAVAQELGWAVAAEGMAGRLFREVRERRGLAYAIDASLHQTNGAAWGTVVAATTPGRSAAAEEVVDSELRKLAQGVSDQELARARALLETREATGAESSSGRAGQLLHDLRVHGRPRTLCERLGELRAPRLADVQEVLAATRLDHGARVILQPEEQT